jgi:hypothetical protein
MHEKTSVKVHWKSLSLTVKWNAFECDSTSSVFLKLLTQQDLFGKIKTESRVMGR